jgi:hypothetical protein
MNFLPKPVVNFVPPNILLLGSCVAGREINECHSETKKNGLGNVTWTPEEGHLTPEVKAASEVTCDYVWDKLYPPHFCNLLKMIRKESPLCFWGSVFGLEPVQLLLACLINLLPKSFGAFSVSV